MPVLFMSETSEKNFAAIIAVGGWAVQTKLSWESQGSSEARKRKMEQTEVCSI